MFFVKGYSKKHETQKKTGICNWPPSAVRGIGYQISPSFATESLAAEFCDLCKGKHDEIVPLAIVRSSFLLDDSGCKVVNKSGKYKIIQTIMRTFENPYKKPKEKKKSE